MIDVFGVSAAVEGLAFLDRLASRRGMHLRARERARTTGRPLVVVGAPSGGFVRGPLAQYACGDLPCVDLGGCALCGAPSRDLRRRGAIPVKDGGAVVLVSHVLEYVDDPEGAPYQGAGIDAAWREVVRACGSPSTDAFVAHVQPWARWARVVYPQRWVVVEAPPASPTLVYRSAGRPPRAMADARAEGVR